MAVEAATDPLATAAFGLLGDSSGQPRPELIRRVIVGWTCNKKRRVLPMPDEVARTHQWLLKNMLPVTVLEDLAVLRRVLDELCKKMDGKPAAAKTVLRKRAVVFNLLEYGVEAGPLAKNRLRELRWTAPVVNRAIDKRVVALNPRQGDRLLREVAAQQVLGQPRRSSGPMLRGYFASMYYAALRPEEAAQLSKEDLLLPSEGWGVSC